MLRISIIDIKIGIFRAGHESRSALKVLIIKKTRIIKVMSVGGLSKKMHFYGCLFR